MREDSSSNRIRVERRREALLRSREEAAAARRQRAASLGGASSGGDASTNHMDDARSAVSSLGTREETALVTNKPAQEREQRPGVPRLSAKFIHPLKSDLISLVDAAAEPPPRPEDSSSDASSAGSPGVEMRPRARHALLQAHSGDVSADFDIFAALSVKPAAPAPKASSPEDEYADEEFEEDHTAQAQGRRGSAPNPLRRSKSRSASPLQPFVDPDDLASKEERRRKAQEYLEQKRRERLRAEKESRKAGSKKKQEIQDKLKQLEAEAALIRKSAPQPKPQPSKSVPTSRRIPAPRDNIGDENLDNMNNSVPNAVLVASQGDYISDEESDGREDAVLTSNTAPRQLRASRYADVSDDNIDPVVEQGFDDTGDEYEHSDVILSPSRRNIPTTRSAGDKAGVPARPLSAPPRMSLLKRHQRKDLGPRKPFKVGVSNYEAQRRAASMRGGSKLARTLSHSKSTSNLLAYSSVESSPPPPPPPRRATSTSSSLTKRRPASAPPTRRGVAPTQPANNRSQMGRPYPRITQQPRASKSASHHGEDIFSLMESETLDTQPVEASRPRAQLSKTVSVLKQVEKSMLEYQESMKLVQDALQQKLRNSSSKANSSENKVDSPNSTADSDSVDLHLGAIRESVASALSAALAKGGSLRHSVERSVESLVPRAPEPQGYPDDEELCVNYESSHGSSSYYSSSDDGEDDNELHEESVGREELAEENEDLENLVLHRESSGDEHDTRDSQASDMGRLSAEAEMYRQSALESMGDRPPPCRASNRPGTKIAHPTSGPADGISDYSQEFVESELPMPRDFETEDPLLRAQIGMMNDKRDILAYYSAPRSFDADVYRDSNEWDQRQSLDNPYISDRLRSQGYYEDRFASEWAAKQHNEDYNVTEYANEQPVKQVRSLVNTAEAHLPPVSLRNVGGLGNSVPVLHSRGVASSGARGVYFRHDEESDDSDNSDNDFERPVSRPSDPFVEGVAYDDPRDVSIMSIFAKKQLKAMQDEKDRAMKEKIVREVQEEMQRAVDSNVTEGSARAQSPARPEKAKVDSDEEERQQRTFWDSLLRRPLHTFGSDLEPTDDELDDPVSPVIPVPPSGFSVPPPVPESGEKKLSASEMRLRLMNALEHHEQLVGYEAELAELHRMQALQTASEMMHKATSQAEIERLHAAYSQEAILQQQAYEMTIATSLNSQRETERAAEQERLRFAEDVQRNAIMQNNILERAQFEVDAAQTIANLRNAAYLFELEQKMDTPATQPSPATRTGRDADYLRPTSPEESALSPSQLNESIEAALKAQEKVFRLRMMELTRERDMQLDASQKRFEELEARGLNVAKQRQNDEKRILKVFTDAMAELDRERWIMKEDICRRLDVRSLLPAADSPARLVGQYDERTSPKMSSPSPVKLSSPNKKNKHDESYASDFVAASQSFAAEISTSYVAPRGKTLKARSPSVDKEISSDEEISRSSSVEEEVEEEEVGLTASRSTESISEEDAYEEDGFESEGRLSKTTDSDSIMDAIMRKQESMRRKHEEIERLIQDKADKLRKKKELILLEEEERELNALMSEAAAIDSRFDAEKFRNKLRSEARRRVEALSSKMLESTSPSPVSTNRRPVMSPSGRPNNKSFEQSAVYDEDFEEEMPRAMDADEESVEEEIVVQSVNTLAKSIIEEPEDLEHTSVKSISEVDSEEDQYHEDFEVSASVLKSSGQKNVPRADESSMESTSVNNLISELDQSVDMHRERIDMLRKTLTDLHGKKGKIDVIKAKLRDRQALLEVESKLLKELEEEATQLRAEKETIRRERLSVGHYSGPSIDLMRLEESVIALETSAKKDLLELREKWEQDVAATDAAMAEEERRQKQQALEAESEKVAHDLMAVLEEPLEEELAIMDEQALVEEDSWASGHVGDMSGSFDSQKRGSSKPAVEKAIKSETDAGLKSTIAHRIMINEAAARIQSAYRCSVARSVTRALRSKRIDSIKELKRTSIEGNLAVEHAYTAYAEELVLEDSFASSENELTIEEDTEIGGLALAETDQLLAAVEKLKDASADRAELESQILDSRRAANIPKDSVAVMESMVPPSSEMKYDATEMKWVETGDNKVDMSGFEESVEESLEGAPDENNEKMEFDRANMKWVGGEPVDMSGFESSEDDLSHRAISPAKKISPTKVADVSADEIEFAEASHDMEVEQSYSQTSYSEKDFAGDVGKKGMSFEQSADVPGPPEDEDSQLLEAVDESLEVEDASKLDALVIEPAPAVALTDSAAETVNWETSPRKPDSVKSEESLSSQSESASGEIPVIEEKGESAESEDLSTSLTQSPASKSPQMSPAAASSPRSKLTPIDIANRNVDRSAMLLDAAVNGPRSKLVPILNPVQVKSPTGAEFSTSPRNKVKLAHLPLSPSENLASPKGSSDKLSDEDSSLEESFMSQTSFSELPFPSSAKTPETVDVLTDEIWKRLVASEMSLIYKDGRSGKKDQEGVSPEKTGVRLLRSLSSSSELPPIHGPGPLSRHHSLEEDEFVTETSGGKVADDERLQMHQQLSHELDELYDFEDDIHVPGVESPPASPPKDERGAEADGAAEEARRLEEMANEKIELSLFWSNRVVVSLYRSIKL